MVRVLIGDMFESECQTLVNTVNCIGIMGKGIALEFKKRFPDMFKEYEARCQRSEVKLGRPYLHKRIVPPWILNFPTKDHWRSVTRLADIEEGLRYLLRFYKEWGITSLAVPPLGCGQGQLEWRIVGPTLYRYLTRMDISVQLYGPYGTPHEELTPGFLEDAGERKELADMPEPEHVRPGWVALVDVVRRILEQPYHWPVGRTIFQKIAYVATEEGIPTGLKFKRGSFGPFSSEVKRVETRLVNNGLIREQKLGRMLAISIGPTFPDAQKAYIDYLDRWEHKIEKITDLFLRLNTRQAEVTSTVLFAAHLAQEAKEDKPSEKDILDTVMQWKIRRQPQLDRGAIASTIRHLAMLNWLDVKGSPDLPLPKEELVDV